MDDLDSSILEIVSEFSGDYVYGADEDTLIREMRQAFVDAGWMNMRPLRDKWSELDRLFQGDEPEKESNLMSGQEWFDAFLQESPSWSELDTTAKSFEKVYINVAKKVSGVEDV